MKYDLNKIKERFKLLPEEVKEAYTSIETTETIIQIRDKYHLHIDQASALAEEMGLVMLGLSKPDDFISTISTKLHVTQMVATEITKDVNNKIFNPIKESLKQIHSLENSGDEPLVKTKPTDSDTIFDSKLKGLFSTSTPNTNKVTDPYHEGI